MEGEAESALESWMGNIEREGERERARDKEKHPNASKKLEL